MSTLADRVWFAIHCLPRDDNGAAPKMSSIEKSSGLSNGVLSTTVREKRREHRSSTSAKMAKGLRVDREWLETGEGVAPVLTGPLPPRPGYEMIAAWEPGAEAPPPGTEAIAAWRPDSHGGAPSRSTSRKASNATGVGSVASKSDDRPDSCPSRDRVVAMARALEEADDDSRGITEGAIAALLAERLNGDDPGEDYWYDRLEMLIERARRLQSKIRGVDK